MTPGNLAAAEGHLEWGSAETGLVLPIDKMIVPLRTLIPLHPQCPAGPTNESIMPRPITGIVGVLLGAVCLQADLARAQMIVPRVTPVGPGVALPVTGIRPLTPTVIPAGPSNPSLAGISTRALPSAPSSARPTSASVALPQALAPVARVGSQFPAQPEAPLSPRVSSANSQPSDATPDFQPVTTQAEVDLADTTSLSPSIPGTNVQRPDATSGSQPGTKAVPASAQVEHPAQKSISRGGPGGKGDGGDSDQDDGNKIPWWVWLLIFLIVLGIMGGRRK